MAGGYASRTCPPSRLAVCQPTGARCAATARTGGIEAPPTGCLPVVGEDEHPAAATKEAASVPATAHANLAVAVVSLAMIPARHHEPTSDVAVTVSWPAVVVAVVVAAVVLRDPASAGARRR